MAALWIRARLCFLGIALGGAGSYLIGGALFANVLLIGSFGLFVVAIVHAANTMHGAGTSYRTALGRNGRA
mgnify:CR=1 FL=1